MHPLVQALGRQVIAFFAFFGETGLLHLDAWRGIVRRKAEYRTTVHQMAHIGVNSLPIAAVTMVLSGAVLAYHGAIETGQWGVSQYAGWLVAEMMFRELGPVLVAFVVAARAGSAMAAELGTMKVTEQIDALRAMATSPVDYLVIPRYIACVVMVPILVFFGAAIGVLGGYAMTYATPGLNPADYFAYIPGHLAAGTVVGGVAKGAIFGMIIAVVSCHQGLRCGADSEEVGRATTRSVVYCIMLVYAADLLFAPLLFHR
jgi:phospholipid/cholesterol/gamma-HCH transport system permease protein